MDLKQLLGKLDLIEGSMEQAAKEPTGPKYTGQWRGNDAGTPGKKLVGSSEQQEESILKDLSKGPTPKTKEQDLAEQFESFLAQLEEDNLGVEEKRPARKGSRPQREYEKTGEQSKRYNYNNDNVKEDDSELSSSEIRDRISRAINAHDEETSDWGLVSTGGEFSAMSRAKKARRDAVRDETDESRGHKVVATKLKDIEQGKTPSAELDLKSREARAKADYAKYVAKMRKLNPNYVPLYKMDEAGANNPPQQNTTTQPAVTPQQQQQAKNVDQGTQALKAAVGSSAPTDVLAKAIDSASQGTAIDATNAKALEPMMDVIKQAAQDPNLANQFKSLASQAKTSAAKQLTQTNQSSTSS